MDRFRCDNDERRSKQVFLWLCAGTSGFWLARFDRDLAPSPGLVGCVETWSCLAARVAFGVELLRDGDPEGR